MAHKSPTYLKFGATSTLRQIRQQGLLVDDDTSLVLTAFVRILQWPTFAAHLWSMGNDIAADGGDYGIWLYADNFASSSYREITGDQYCLGVRVARPGGASYEYHAEMDPSGGIPGRLGMIHQLQLAMKYESGVNTTYTALFVNGVSCMQKNWVGKIGNLNPYPESIWGDDPELRWANTYAWNERACFDLIQWRWEVDRSVTVSGGVVVAPDSVLDPWEELTLTSGVNTSMSGVYLLDEGSGTTAYCNEGGLGNAGLISPEWADLDEVDPIIDAAAGTATYKFKNIYGYPIESSDSPEVYPQPILVPVGDRTDLTAGELRLRTRPAIWREHGQARAWSAYGKSGEWDVNALAGLSTTHQFWERYGTYTSYAAGTAFSSKSYISSFGGVTSFPKCMLLGGFYDTGGTGANTHHRLGLANVTWQLKLMIGVHVSQSSTHYVTRCADSGGNQVSSVARSTGWHEVGIVWWTTAGPSDTVWFILDGAVIRTETGAGVAGSAFYPLIRHQMNSDTDGERSWWDYLAFNRLEGNTPSDFQALVSPTGTIVLPKLQPASVVAWDGVTITDVTAGSSSLEVGTAAYEFRSSTNGGSSWGTWQTLNDTNLQAISCDGDGLDALELRPDLDSGMSGMSSPAVREIEVQFTSGIAPRAFHHRQQMVAGAC